MKSDSGFRCSELWLILVGLAILAVASPCGAQTNLATVRGTVTDPSGATIPKASVVIMDEATNATRKTVSNANGEFEIPYVSPGTYLLTCTAPGFEKFVARDVAIVGFETRRVDVQMHVGSANTQVTVTAGAAVIATENAQITGGFTQKVYKDSPVSTQIFPSAQMIMSPLVQSEQGGFNLTIAGLPPSQVEESMDGVENDGAYNLVNNAHDAQDLQITTANSPAEFSRAVNFTMSEKGGSNAFHGSAAFDEVNSALNARFALSPTKPSFKTHLGIGEFSGPLKKDRTFFYVNYTLIRVPAATFYNETVPDALERQGNFSEFSTPIINPYTGVQFPGNIINTPFSSVTSTMQQKYIPLPNQGPGGPVANNFGYLFPHPSDLYKMDAWDARVDHNFSAKHSVFGRYQDRITPYLLAGDFPNVGTWTRNRYEQSVVGSDTYTFSPTLVNNFRWGWAVDHIHDGIPELGYTPATGDVAVAAIGLQGVNPDGYKIMGFPQTTITGISALSQQPGGLTTDMHIYSYTESLTWAKGRHVVKFGGEIRHWTNSTQQYPVGTYGSFAYDGRFTGNAYADFLLGLPGTSSRLNPLVSRTAFANEQGYYAEDSFKVTSKFTVNYGLRWEYLGFPTYRDGLVYNWDSTTGDVIIPQAALNQVSPLYPTSKINLVAGQAVPSADTALFRPRIGAAYRISDKFVIRGGYGMFTNEWGIANGGDPISATLLTTPAPFSIAETYSNQLVNGTPALSMPDPFPASIASAVVPGQSVTGFPKQISNGAIHEFNVSIERQVRSVGLSISYIGNRGRGIDYAAATDKPEPSLTPFSSSENPYPQFVSTTYYMTNGQSKYDALLFEAKRTLGHLTFDANYTYANSMANYLNLQNPYDLLQWNHDQYTARQRAVIEFLYPLPFGKGQRWGSNMPAFADAVVGGWRVNWISTFQSGQYFSPSFSGSDPSHTNTVGGVPDRICNGNLGSGQRGPNHWFNAACFAVPQAGHFGDSGVDILEGPRTNVSNMTIGKEFPIKERFRLTLEGLFLDMFNTPTYAFPAANISSPGTVGVISSSLGGLNVGGGMVETGGERAIVLRARIEF